MTYSFSEVHDQGPSDLIKLAPHWHWTGEKLSNDPSDTSTVYSLADKTDNEVTAAIKVYKTKLGQTPHRSAQREVIILKKLQGKYRIVRSSLVNLLALLGLGGIPRFIASNFTAQMTIESDNDPWIIMKRIEGVTLSEFIHSTSASFRDKLEITLDLLNIVKGLHSRNVVHRYINPDNIMIKTSSDGTDDHNSLFLIDFCRAYLTQDDDPSNKMIFEDDRNHIWNAFYQPSELEKQPSIDDNNNNSKRKNMACTRSIDASYVCAVLFWMITECPPRESRNIHGEAPHQRKDHASAIKAELTKATGY